MWRVASPSGPPTPATATRCRCGPSWRWRPPGRDALAILNVADVQAAARAMQWLITSNRDHGQKVDRGTVASWGKGTTAVLTAAQLVACGPYEFPSTELRYRAGTPMPTRPAHDKNSATALAAKVP